MQSGQRRLSNSPFSMTRSRFSTSTTNVSKTFAVIVTRLRSHINSRRAGSSWNGPNRRTINLIDKILGFFRSLFNTFEPQSRQAISRSAKGTVGGSGPFLREQILLSRRRQLQRPVREVFRELGN